MSSIHVCPLNKIADVAAQTGARRMITLINAGTPVIRPGSIAEADHLFLGFNDITTAMAGMTPPGEEHVRALLAFGEAWDRADPMIGHCFAGISRSTAGAYILSCHFSPDEDEERLAGTLRSRASSATPNRRLVEIADALLGRNGRMVDAIDSIGRGAEAYEGTPFRLDIGPGARL